jgi:hypothetical protein
MIDFRAMVLDDGVPIEAIAEYLDKLTPDARREAMVLPRKHQRVLFGKALASPAIDLEHFVPADREPLVPVHHYGRNTLPLPSFGRNFQKRFCRPQDGSQRLFGYNESPFLTTVGPGFYVAVPTAPNAEWVERGPIVVDYFLEPDGPVPATWPKVRPNSRGLQMFVYKGTRDFMRKVSEHCSIGVAYKGEKFLDHYFTLTRQA